MYFISYHLNISGFSYHSSLLFSLCLFLVLNTPQMENEDNKFKQSSPEKCFFSICSNIKDKSLAKQLKAISTSLLLDSLIGFFIVPTCLSLKYKTASFRVFSLLCRSGKISLPLHYESTWQVNFCYHILVYQGLQLSLMMFCQVNNLQSIISTGNSPFQIEEFHNKKGPDQRNLKFFALVFRFCNLMGLLFFWQVR